MKHKTYIFFNEIHQYAACSNATGTYSLYMQAKFTAVKLNAIPVNSVKKKKSYPIFRIWTTQKHYRTHVTGLSVNTSFKLFYGTPQAQLSINQNRFFKIHKAITWRVHYVNLYNLSALSQVTAERPLQNAVFFSTLPLPSLRVLIVSASRFRSEFHLPLLKLNMLLSHTRFLWNKVLIKTSEAGRLHPYSYFTVVTA